jgi:uncharacterized repeat protein (TIGR02543 family)
MKTKRPLPKRFSGRMRVSGILVGLLAVLLSAASVAIAAPFAYVSSFGTDRVTVVDGATGSIAASIPVGAMPYGVAVNPAGTRAYVANFGDGSVSIIDTATNTVIGSPLTVCGAPGCMPTGVAVNAAGTRVYVANGDGTIAVIDATSNTLMAPLARTTGAFGGIVVVGSSVFVVDFGGGNVLAVDVNTGTVTPIPLSFSMFGIAASPSGSRVYVPYGKINLNQEYDLEVAVIDPNGINGPEIVASVPVGSLDNNSGASPAGIAVSPSGTRVYVAVSAENKVEVIDAGTNTRVGSPISVGASPYGVAFDASGARVFVGNSGGSGTLSMIDTPTNAVSAPVTVGTSAVVFGSFVGTPPPPQFLLTLSTNPLGAGTIGAQPTSTTGQYDSGTQVSVTATANTGYQFTGWSGACTGTGPCNVTMTADRSVTANFAVVQYTLTPATNPSGAGMITPSAPGKYDYTTTVSVTATANTGYQFTGWSGACTGTGPCSVLMTADRSVTANFAVVQYTLTLGASPSGAGTVTAQPASANGKYNYNSSVSVTATANTGYQFTGWSGACTGTGPCSALMTADNSVTANFAVVQVQQFTLTLTKDGTGTGTVGALPSSSTGRYDAGTNVAVTATPGAGCKFTGWSGACSGNANCSVRMDSSKSIGATFTLTSPCDDRIGDLQKKVAADRRHVKYGHDLREAFRLYAAAEHELAKARAKVDDHDKRYLSALREFNNGKAALCAGRYWRAAHEFWEAYQIAHRILERHRR